VTRVFPANGKFSPRQREFYSIYLKLYQAVATSIQVHVAPRDIMKQAVVKMDAIMASFPFTDPRIQSAAQAFVDRYRNSRSNELGHTIGVEVHDVPRTTETLEPGQIFTIEPAMTIPDEHIAIRLEDVFLIQEDGVENLSAFVPIEIDDIEALMAQPGLSDAAIHLPGRSIR
jgi:Xaa-Pro aminopeptidase